MSFVHLHVHSEYSLLDGFSNIKKLVKRAKELEMPAIALTDHGTMFGTIEFYNAATTAGVKPIIGLEAYLAPRRMGDRDSRLDKQAHHLLLLAENNTGYQNLLKIASAAQLQGFYYNPRIDHEFLEAHSEGLICTSGCLAAEVPRTITNAGLDAARLKLDWYYEVFGPDRFFIELQEHPIPELMTVNKALLDLGPRYNARYIATNDVHYINPADARMQDILLAIQTGALLSDPNRMRMGDASYYLRTPQEMAGLFANVPGAVDNTLWIAERCQVDLAPSGYHLPLFPVPDGKTAESYLRELCEEGWHKRYDDRAGQAELRERLEYELRVIHQMGFDTYFLIVWDLCRYAREQGIWYNARGSAAGSMVAYALDITLVEPIEHGLIFERFLNPGRISMPDIDLDFQDDMRSKVMEYCARRYGDDKVAQIITFGTLGARAAIRDVGRVMDVPAPDVDRVAKLIPNTPGKPVSISEALEQIPELKQIYAESEYLRELIDTAKGMEGAVRNAGTHAAGVLITDRPMIEYVPLHRPTSGAEESPIKSVSQFEMSIVDGLGLLKVDFLGLASLTVMQRACQMIAQRHGKQYTLNNIPVDDADTFAFLGQGHTAGVFQLEGTGMTRYLVQMQPRNLDNIIAMVALYRPGPLEFIPNYIRRMHGEEKVSYRHPMMEETFKDTFGIPIYQEQLMFAAMRLAGYNASEADDLRKAISKKKADVLAKHRAKFVEGAQTRGISAEVAAGIFEDWENFARYGFNKCLPGDTEIVDPASGRVLTIADLYEGKAALQEVMTCDTDALRLQRGALTAVRQNGLKPVFRLTTALGRSITATGNHPFYTCDGWHSLDRLAPGDFVAVPRALPVEGSREWPEHQVIALGHLLAEGNLCHPHSLYYYSQDTGLRDDFIRAAEQFENVRCKTALHKDTFSVYAGRVDRTQPPEIMTWARGLGITGVKAPQKAFPAGAFELPNRQVALLLSRMWEGDGHIDVKSRSLFYATASERLARQMQHLLLRLGIISRLRSVVFPYKEGRQGWQLFITHRDNIQSFARQIGVHFVSVSRRLALTHLVERCESFKTGPSTKDIVPAAPVKALVRAARERRGLAWTQLSADAGIAPREFYPTNSAGKVGFNRHTLERLAAYFEDPALRRFAQSDIYWDRIVSIEPVGEQMTYDLEVARTHNFVANDILVHNSHAADYGVIAVQTAYLKTHFTEEYMTALLSASKNDSAKVALYVADCRAMNVDVLPPDINRSMYDFSIEDRPEQKAAIRFGLGAIKNVGQAPVELVLASRQDGPFRDLNDFARRVDLRQMGKRPLECMIRVGALDAFGPRKSLLAALDQVMSVSSSHFRALQSGQLSFFGSIAGVEEDIALPPSTSLDQREQLEWERELIGLYVSDHPLTPYLPVLNKKISHYSSQLAEVGAKDKVAVAGLVTRFRPHQTKSGKSMAFVTLEDIQGNLELVVFPKTWEAYGRLVEFDAVLLAEGKVDNEGGDPKILVDRLSAVTIADLEAVEEMVARPGPAAPKTAVADEVSPPPEEPFPWDDLPPQPEEDWFPPLERDEPRKIGERPAQPLTGPQPVTAAPAARPEPPAPRPVSPTSAREPEPPPIELSEPPRAQSFAVPDKAPFVPISYLVPPAGSSRADEAASDQPRMITVVLRSTGDKQRDVRRLRRVYGLLQSHPGRDRFAFMIYENGTGYLMEFPNDTTGVSPDLVRTLADLVGAENVRVEFIQLQ